MKQDDISNANSEELYKRILFKKISTHTDADQNDIFLVDDKSGLLREALLRHHTFRHSPVCVLLCRLRPNFSVKPSQQSSLTFGFSPVSDPSAEFKILLNWYLRSPIVTHMNVFSRSAVCEGLPVDLTFKYRSHILIE